MITSTLQNGKITKGQIRAAFPAEIGKQVIAKMETHRVAKISFRLRAAGETLYLDEDQRYTVIKPDGSQNSVRMNGEWAGYTNTNPIAQAVAKSVPVAQGCWVIEEGYFLGKYLINVDHWGLAALPA